MADQPFNTPVSGQSDWDSGLGVDFQALERGYHITERAGQAISSGQFVALNSGAFAFPWNPSSTPPCAGMAYTAAASGDTFTFLAWGIVRSLGINSVSIPGRILFSNASGFLSTTTLGAPIGIGLANYGVLVRPAMFKGHKALAELTDVDTTAVSSGKVLMWTDATSVWKPVTPPGGANALAQLTDVDTTGVGQDKILKWSNASSKWVIATDSGGAAAVGPPALTIVMRVATQYIRNGVWECVNWDTSVQDDVSAFNVNSGTYITVPSGYTKAEFSAMTVWGNNSTGARYGMICSSTAILTVAPASIFAGDVRGAVNESFATMHSRIFNVNSGDRIMLEVNQTSTITLSFNGNGFPRPAYLECKWYP